MKVLIVRMVASEHDCTKQTYNTQGIGLATELVRLGHEVGLVYYANPGNGREELIESNGYSLQIYHIEGKAFMGSAIFNEKLYQLCDEYDVIQPSEVDQIGSWLLYSKYPTKTVIYHGPYESIYTPKHNLYSKIFNLCFSWRKNYKKASIITKSRLAEETLRRQGFPNVVTLGVGLNQYILETQVDEIPDNLKCIVEEKNDKKYLLFIGAVSKRKNLLFVLQMLDQLVHEKKRDAYKLLVVGKPTEQDYYQECLNFIKDHKLHENVSFCGSFEQKYLKYFYRKSDVFLLPTRYDIYGMVYLEAMYFGVPIVTSLCGGSSLLIEDGKTGYIRELNDIDGWSSAVVASIEDESREQMTRKEQETIKSTYLWSKLSPKFIEVYENTIRL